MNRLEREKVIPLIREGLKEDIGDRDLTTEAIVPDNYEISGGILLKERAVLSGLEIVEWVFGELDGVETTILVEEGVWLPPQDVINIKGNATMILMGERLALNFIQRLSGITTLTRKFVDAIEGTQTKILDTRKTTPLFRYLEKYAVSIGGGVNHRKGLYDAVLIKENHIRIAGGIKESLSMVKGEIEVRNLFEMKEAIDNGATHLLLDNMTIEEIKRAVEVRGDSDIILEVSGGVTLENVREIALTGVDYISVGSLTHSYTSIDLSLILR
ncbi:carboxylating nicotinate-nucleotide diphosphorylase [candidate division WOR-3 bacterium]|nr:carboxylating nicotinate-nucleotide diphosphorylase [candidate division WOR-3 bacterium]